MKTKLITAILCLLSIFVMALAGSASAYNSAYSATCYETQGTNAYPTVDGKTVAASEWADGNYTLFGTNGVFVTEWSMSPVYASFFISTMDTTNDAGDYWEMCFDSTAAGGTTEPNGGAAPQTDDFKLVVTGHDSPTVQWYKGTGTAWAAVTPVGFSDTAIFQQAQALSGSINTVGPVNNATAHYQWEMHIDKTNTAGLGIALMGYDWAQYVAYYDAHAGGYGLQSWPPAPAADTNPNSWGYVPYSMDPAPFPLSTLPEGFSVAIILALSSVAVVAGAVLVRKRISIPKLVTA